MQEKKIFYELISNFHKVLGNQNICFFFLFLYSSEFNPTYVLFIYSSFMNYIFELLSRFVIDHIHNVTSGTRHLASLRGGRE